MSEPIRRENDYIPESYSPKDMPEILSIAKEINENATNQEMPIEPQIVSKAFLLVGLESAIDFGSDFQSVIAALYKGVNDRLNRISGVAKPAKMIGFWHTGVLPSGEYEDRYFAGVETECLNPPDGLIAKKLPESLYAVFNEQRRGQMGGPDGYAYKWLHASWYEGNDNIPGDFEVFKNMTDTGSESEAEIYLPIRIREGKSSKSKSEASAMTETGANAPGSIKIPFSGAIENNGPEVGPHTRAFASAVTALAVLMGAPHDTSVLAAHNKLWSSDNDYYRHLMVSGEGFLFCHGVADFFTDAFPPQTDRENESKEMHYSWAKDVTPILDCFEIAGVKAEVYSNYPSKGVKGGWNDTQTLEELTLRNLENGFPALLFCGERGGRIMLGTGYENSGKTLLAWPFTAGDRMKTNAQFSSAKCKRVKNWAENVLAVVLIKSAFIPPKNIKPLLVKALIRGAEMLQTDINLVKYRETFCGTGKPRIYPEIWDLAERRFYLAAALGRVAEVFETDMLTAAIDASRQIHDHMWTIYAIWKEKKTKEAKRKIADILDESRQLDIKIADTISSFLKNQDV